MNEWALKDAGGKLKIPVVVSKSKRINYVRLLPIKISYNRRVQEFSLYPPRGGDVRLLSESPRG
jgi:hypothetical protein